MKRAAEHRFLLLSALLLFAVSGCASRQAAEQRTTAAPDRVAEASEAGSENIDASVQDDDPDAVANLGTSGESSGYTGADAPAPDTAPDTGPTNNAVEGGDPTAGDAAATADGEAGPDPEMIERPTAETRQPCYQPPAEEGTPLLDRSQKQLYRSVCNTVAWFDGFFGDKRYDNAYRNTFGRVSASGFWDQYDGFDTRFRFRARLRLPALNDRTNLLIGRGDERNLIEDQQRNQSDTIPNNFNQVDDDSFLFGLGYSKNRGLKRGFDLSVGVRLRTPPDPYAKARYRRSWNISESTLFRLNPVVYWKLDEGFGATLNGTLDHLLAENLVFRWSASGNISEDKEVEGVGWNNWFSLFQALANRRALSYHAFVLGETKADVKTQNFGFELRYRQRILREWLFLDIVTSYSWPRFVLEEEREGNFGIGAGFEMFFGPVPDVQLR